ncbi:MAG: FeoB-associated Cys-rich membrane protein [Oscillospiraceae bacterium]|nr:FeoB-associated Cys-rich membrane protein [Oscillospiraceae bacterium]
MNLASIIICLLIAVAVVGIIARGVYNRRHHVGCSCGCEGCAHHDQCCK